MLPFPNWRALARRAIRRRRCSALIDENDSFRLTPRAAKAASPASSAASCAVMMAFSRTLRRSLGNDDIVPSFLLQNDWLAVFDKGQNLFPKLSQIDIHFML